MNELEQFQQTYFQECEELLADLESHLLTLQEDGTDVEAMHAVFRAIHSIKGGAGAFGFDRLVSFSHAFETTLDLMREGQLETSSDNIELSVLAADIVADLVHAAQSGDDLAPGHESEMLNALKDLIGDEGDNDDTDFDEEIGFVPIMVGDDAQDAGAGDDNGDETEKPVTTYRIAFVPHSEMLQRANEPLLLIRELKSLGAVTATPDLSRLPDLQDMNPEDAYIGWQIDLISSADLDAVEEVFEFVDSDCELEISLESEAEGGHAAPVEDGAAPDVTVSPEPASAAAPEKKTSANKVTAGASAPTPVVSTIRVDLAKMDRLVNMVGELVITQAMLAQQGGLLPSDKFPNLIRGLDELSQHTRGLQDSVMAMRAQPVKSVFSRLPRLVRELSAQTGKKVRLVMSGETTEIDKTVIEQLGDPLTHMIRNAVDHGIESPEEREKAGKPPEGTIHLSAEHRSGRILIEINDDGKGVNRERVMQKAVEKGLVPPNSALTNEQIDNLIFHPGFSTAESISNISGRGVGMDVVVRNIQSLGGRVMVRSTPGAGSCFSMTLPLTLAVLDGMIVRSGMQSYVIPLANIIESLRPLEQDVYAVTGDEKNMVLAIRGEYIQLVYLHRVFGIPGAVDDPSKGLVVVAEAEDGARIGIVVDEILGQQQVVIKSLEDNFNAVGGVGAATILGNGNVSLILDLTALKDLVGRWQSKNGQAGRMPDAA